MSCFFFPTDSSSDDDNSINDDDSFVLRVAVGSSNPCKVAAVRQALDRLLQSSHDRQATTTLDIQAFSVASGVDDQPFGDADTMQGSKNRAKAAYQAYREANDGVGPHLAMAMEGGLEWIVITQCRSNNNDTTRTAATRNKASSSTDSESSSSSDDDRNLASSSSSSASSNNILDDDDDNNNSHSLLFCMAWIAVYGKRTGSVLERLCNTNEVASYMGDRAPVFGLARSASFPLPDAIRKLVMEHKMELGEADAQVFGRSEDDSKRGQGTVGILTDGLIDRASYYEHAILLALTMWIRPDVYPTGLR
jgi:non-canonical (house-cleaning) NTP pyrophosphatase